LNAFTTCNPGTARLISSAVAGCAKVKSLWSKAFVQSMSVFPGGTSRAVSTATSAGTASSTTSPYDAASASGPDVPPTRSATCAARPGSRPPIITW
jgi:hypothetical protein